MKWMKVSDTRQNMMNQEFQYHLVHLRIDRTEPRPSVPGVPKALKVHTYRPLSRTIRSIYSLLNCLPATSFAENLSGTIAFPGVR
jgi:hypothetical protein